MRTISAIALAYDRCCGTACLRLSIPRKPQFVVLLVDLAADPGCWVDFLQALAATNRRSLSRRPSSIAENWRR